MSRCQECGATFGHLGACRQGQLEDAIAKGVQLGLKNVLNEYHTQQQLCADLARKNEQLQSEVNRLRNEAIR